MKNIILFIILVILVSIAYFSGEVSDQNNRKRELKASALTTLPEEINSIQLSGTTISLKESNWWINQLGYPASSSRILQLLNIIKSLKKEIELQDSSQNFFSDFEETILIKGSSGVSELTIGNMSQVTGRFYAKVDNKVYLVSDSSIYRNTYKSNEELRIKKYIRLKNLLLSKPQDWIFRSLLFPQELKLKKVRIDNTRNRWFDLDFLSNTTNPAILKPLDYLNLATAFQEKLSKVFIKRVIRDKQIVLTSLISEVKLIEDNNEITLKLYGGLNGIYGKYLKRSHDPNILELDANSTELFYSNVQDYWNKTHFTEVDFSKVKTFDFKLKKVAGEKYLFRVPSLESFKVEAISPKVNNLKSEKFNFLFNLILNLVDFKQASFVETFRVEDLLKKPLFQVELFSKLLHVEILESQIKIYDVMKKNVFTYQYTNERIGSDYLQDIFTVTKN